VGGKLSWCPPQHPRCSNPMSSLGRNFCFAGCPGRTSATTSTCSSCQTQASTPFSWPLWMSWGSPRKLKSCCFELQERTSRSLGWSRDVGNAIPQKALQKDKTGSFFIGYAEDGKSPSRSSLLLWRTLSTSALAVL